MPKLVTFSVLIQDTLYENLLALNQYVFNVCGWFHVFDSGY